MDKLSKGIFMLYKQIYSKSVVLAHAEVLAVLVVDETTGLLAIEARWGYDEVGNIEGKETVAVETARILLRQHECLACNALSIYMTEIRPREETVVTT